MCDCGMKWRKKTDFTYLFVSILLGYLWCVCPGFCPFVFIFYSFYFLCVHTYKLSPGVFIPIAFTNLCLDVWYLINIQTYFCDWNVLDTQFKGVHNWVQVMPFRGLKWDLSFTVFRVCFRGTWRSNLVRKWPPPWGGDSERWLDVGWHIQFFKSVIRRTPVCQLVLF